MTREQYLGHRKNNEMGNIVYHHYKLVSARMGHSPLDPNKFLQLFNLWPHNHVAVEDAVKFYDVEFDILILTNSKGEIVNFF